MSFMALSSFAMADNTYSDYEVDKDEYARFAEGFKIMTGYEDGTFRPDNPITRAEFVKAMLTMGEGVFEEKENINVDFSDVAESHWAYDEISKAVSIGFINGYNDGTFRPDDNITYEQAVTMIFTALGYKPVADLYGGYPHAYMSLAYYNRFFKTDIPDRVASLEMNETKQKTNVTRRDALCLFSRTLLTPICYVTDYEITWDASFVPVYTIGGDDVVTKTIYSLKNVTVVEE